MVIVVQPNSSIGGGEISMGHRDSGWGGGARNVRIVVFVALRCCDIMRSKKRRKIKLYILLRRE